MVPRQAAEKEGETTLNVSIPMPPEVKGQLQILCERRGYDGVNQYVKELIFAALALHPPPEDTVENPDA